jgi:hypothetical protein
MCSTSPLSVTCVVIALVKFYKFCDHELHNAGWVNELGVEDWVWDLSPPMLNSLS